jgi:plasmid stabilization system protein ParE
MADYLLSPEALEDLQSIWDFVAADSTDAADKLLDKLFEAFETLARWPGQGHTRADLTNRDVHFWPVGNYLVVYRGTLDPLQIVAILHGARDVPSVIEDR